MAYNAAHFALAFILVALFVCLFVCYLICITLLVVSGCNYHRRPAMMEFFLSGSLPLIDFVICDVMSDMANKLLSLSLLESKVMAANS